MYKPIFQHDVKLQGPHGSYSINPNLSLTEKSAEELAEIIRQQKGWDDLPFIVTISMRPPMPLFGPWNAGGVTVPWFVFQDGPDATGDEARFTAVNAGGYADIFTHGYPEKYCIRQMVYAIGQDRHSQNPDRNAFPNP